MPVGEVGFDAVLVDKVPDELSEGDAAGGEAGAIGRGKATRFARGEGGRERLRMICKGRVLGG